jgi:hypothetical protein
VQDSIAWGGVRHLRRPKAMHQPLGLSGGIPANRRWEAGVAGQRSPPPSWQDGSGARWSSVT